MNNFLLRTITGIVFLLVMVFGLIWDRAIFGALFLFILYFALNEFYTITLQGRFKLQQKLGMLTAATAFVTVAAHCFYGVDARFICLLLLPMLLIPVTAVFLGVREDFQDIALVYAGLLYIALPISLSPFIMMDGPVFDGWLMLSFFIVIWLSDVGTERGLCQTGTIHFSQEVVGWILERSRVCRDYGGCPPLSDMVPVPAGSLHRSGCAFVSVWCVRGFV